MTESNTVTLGNEVEGIYYSYSTGFDKYMTAQACRFFLECSKLDLP